MDFTRQSYFPNCLNLLSTSNFDWRHVVRRFSRIRTPQTLWTKHGHGFLTTLFITILSLTPALRRRNQCVLIAVRLLGKLRWPFCVETAPRVFMPSVLDWQRMLSTNAILQQSSGFVWPAVCHRLATRFSRRQALHETFLTLTTALVHRVRKHSRPLLDTAPNTVWLVVWTLTVSAGNSARFRNG